MTRAVSPEPQNLAEALDSRSPLSPPDLVIQDELHLISGPLGTMAGLYEAAIEGLCVREIDGRAVRPKIVASTATVRRAQDQIQALFARPLTQIFPPPGPNRRDAFFARTVPASEIPARLYLGITSPRPQPQGTHAQGLARTYGRSPSARTATQADTRNTENPADPYMTVLGYFNSLRELGRAPGGSSKKRFRTRSSPTGARKRVGRRGGTLP